MEGTQNHESVMTLQKIVLFGAGGMGKEMALLVSSINEKEPTFDLLGFVVDKEFYQPGESVNGVEVLGTTQWLIEHKNSVACVVCIGDAKERLAVFERLKALGVNFATLIAPDVYIDDTVSVGEGCIVTFRCMISLNTTLEDGVFLNSDVTIGHDCLLHKCATVYPRGQVSGGCIIGAGAQVSSCSFLAKNARIGEKAVVAPLSAVYGKVKSGTYVIGNPAHRIEL